MIELDQPPEGSEPEPEQGTYVQLYSPSARRGFVLGPFADDEAAEAWLRSVGAPPGPRAAVLPGMKPTDWQGSLYER